MISECSYRTTPTNIDDYNFINVEKDLGSKVAVEIGWNNLNDIYIRSILYTMQNNKCS